jgi:ComF family protein
VTFMLDALVSVLFAAPCRICGDLLDDARLIPICASCFNAFQALPELMCARCGRPSSNPSAGFAPGAAVTAAAAPAAVVLEPHPRAPAELRCRLCRLGIYRFDRARSFASYNLPMRKAIILLKYMGVARLGAWFAERLEEIYRVDRGLFPVDAVVPVPLHPLRLRERGYNQAERIARPLAKRLELPLLPLLLVRTRPRPEQLLLSRAERWSSVKGAYAATPRARAEKLRVLLVDDVFTTGATLDACARALFAAGAASVYALTVARAIPQHGDFHPSAALARVPDVSPIARTQRVAVVA